MGEAVGQELVQALDELLEEERAALLKGDVDRINRLAERKGDLITRIDALGDFPRATLASLQEKLRRNSGLIEQALEGIRAAAARVQEMRQVRETLQTYDQRGKRRDLTMQTGRSVEKRA
ncbi:flagellar export chaperone FlgN [Aestuariivita boseongensis]|uniref:flagellar export chaperone FlgN n=1 Tax=Aestuariivita boseongensis TaxID=1470562 RepID=UPI0006824CA6|nr:flagellar export chaperone FlgN [Aestuariivita boseongensis]